jgi:hypothetical protein
MSSITLASLYPDTTVPLPMSLTRDFPTWFVPTETSGISVSQTSSLPAMFDFSPYAGDPDLASSASGSGPLCSDSASASYNPPGGAVTAGYWEAGPTECGPYPGPAPAGTATINMTAETKGFDASVSSATGDLFYDFAVDPSLLASFDPVVVDPGASAVIDVTINPSAPRSVGQYPPLTVWRLELSGHDRAGK